MEERETRKKQFALPIFGIKAKHDTFTVPEANKFALPIFGIKAKRIRSAVVE